jgi:hypothetical protein
MSMVHWTSGGVNLCIVTTEVDSIKAQWFIYQRYGAMYIHGYKVYLSKIRSDVYTCMDIKCQWIVLI